MKLILAIVNNDDSHAVSSALTREGYSATKLSTTGGFLMAGNTTFLVGTDESKVEPVIEIIKQHSRKRNQMAPVLPAHNAGVFATMPVEVVVGGATIFVLDVEKFEKI